MDYQDKINLVAPHYTFLGKTADSKRVVVRDDRYGVTFTYIAGAFLRSLRANPDKTLWSATDCLTSAALLQPQGLQLWVGSLS